jgi:hypothetical protein
VKRLLVASFSFVAFACGPSKNDFNDCDNGIFIEDIAIIDCVETSNKITSARDMMKIVGLEPPNVDVFVSKDNIFDCNGLWVAGCSSVGFIELSPSCASAVHEYLHQVDAAALRLNANHENWDTHGYWGLIAFWVWTSQGAVATGHGFYMLPKHVDELKKANAKIDEWLEIVAKQ